MTHDAGQPNAADDLRRWLDDAIPPQPTVHREENRSRHGPRWRRLMVTTALVVPWTVVVLAVQLGGDDPREPEPVPARPAPTTGPIATPPTPSARPFDGPQPPAPAAAEPLAIRLVRDAVTRTGTATTTALDTAAAEPARAVAGAGATWIVRVHAVVLRGDRRRWRSSSHEVWAVPIGRRDGAVVGLDTPWRVASGDPRRLEPAWQPANVDVDAVRGALRRAGIPGPKDLVVERHRSLPGVLRAVDETRSGRAHVWLRTSPSLAVLGGGEPTGTRP